MNILSHVFELELAEQLGRVLIHFLWQGIGVAVVFSLTLAGLRRSSANARYAVSCIGLLLMAVLPAITFCCLSNRPATDVVVSRPGSQRMELRLDDDAPPNAVVISSDVAASSNDGAVPLIEPTLPVGTASSGKTSSVESIGSLMVRVDQLLRPWLPSITGLWLIGVTVLSIRLLLTWKQVQKLQTTGVSTADPGHLALLNTLSQNLGVRQIVRLLKSSLVEVPTVIGWLKPVILLPITSVTALTTSQLEAILAHELAHIRRADYVVNILQSLIETLLFYHPAVWWISSRIRQERENCCDDLAASISGDAAGYVAALVRMEELRCEPPGVALAARGGDLLSRVKRLLVPNRRDRLSPWWLTGTLSLAVVAVVIGLPIASKSQPAKVAADDKQTTTAKPKTDDAAQPNDEQKRSVDLTEQFTPSQIADKIEEARKRYQSIEYSATVEETRNTNAFAAEPKPMLVHGPGSIHFITDGNRWLVDEKSFTYRSGTTVTSPTQTTSSFDGMTHSVLRAGTLGGTLVIGEEEFAHDRLDPKEMFWQGGLSANWLLTALRRPEAKLTETIELAETTCLRVQVEWKPDWDAQNREFDMMICPEQGWLPRRVRVKRGGKQMSESFIESIEKTQSGFFYPGQINITHPETDNTPERSVKVTDLRERSEFTPRDFAVPRRLGIDIVDHRQGVAWHNDPWWDELAPWSRENILWPSPDLYWTLKDLQSLCDPAMFGAVAPSLKPGEWLNEPGQSDWARPGRKLSVLYFFGGRLSPPTPTQLKALDHLYQRYRESGLEVIGIANNTDSPEAIRQSVKELNLSFPVAIDSNANAAGVDSKVDGSHWGATSVAFKQKTYTGTLLIDSDGTIVQITPQAQGLPKGVSTIEILVRDRLLKLTGSADSPSHRRSLVSRTSKLLRGADATAEEIEAAVRDDSPNWLDNAQKKIVASIPQAQIEILTSGRLTVEVALADLNRNEVRLTRAGIVRIENEWKRRVSQASANGSISGTVQHVSGTEKIACKATITLSPVLRLLSSSMPGGWYVDHDRSRQRTIEIDSTGKIQIDNLPKGTYELTIASPGLSRTTRTVYLPEHQSQVDVEFVLQSGDTISGKVTDGSGKAIPNATVRAVLRYADTENEESSTTGDLPRQPATTGQNGEFGFESLYEGKFAFEVKADGYETRQTEKIPAGKTDVNIVLKLRAGALNDKPNDR